MSKSAEIRRLITKYEVSLNEVSSMPTVLIGLWKDACISLITQLECERMILTTSEVKGIVTEDILMAKKNLATIKGVEALNRLNLGDFILN